MSKPPVLKPPAQAEQPSRKMLWAVSLAFGVFVGATAGLGVVFHDGRDWTYGLFTGLGFFVFGFLLFFFRFGRRLAALLSSLP